MSPEKITAWSAVVQASAAVASLIVAAVLVRITHRYATFTKEILEETAKARKATEDSARAALETTQLAKRQIEEQTDVGETILDTTLWKVINAAETILAPDPFVNSRARDALARLWAALDDAGAAIRHSARTNPETAKILTTCFENIRSGANDAQSIVQMTNPSPSNPAFRLKSNQAEQTLRNAVDHLKKIKSERNR